MVVMVAVVMVMVVMVAMEVCKPRAQQEHSKDKVQLSLETSSGF